MKAHLIYMLRRVLAYFVDVFIVYSAVMLLLQSLLLTPVRNALGWDWKWFEDPTHMYLYVLLSISLPGWLYFIGLDGYRGRNTFGKRLFKLQLRRPNGKTLGWQQVPARVFLKLLPWELAHIGMTFPEPMFAQEQPQFNPLLFVSMGLPLFYLGTLWFSQKGQTVYDRLIGTAVIGKKKATVVFK